MRWSRPISLRRAAIVVAPLAITLVAMTVAGMEPNVILVSLIAFVIAVAAWTTLDIADVVDTTDWPKRVALTRRRADDVRVNRITALIERGRESGATGDVVRSIVADLAATDDAPRPPADDPDDTGPQNATSARPLSLDELDRLLKELET